jgi:hypothetical protein
LIDREKKLCIISSDIDYFLRSNGKVLRPEEINRIFRSLAWPQQALRHSEKIYFDRFSAHIDPFGKGYYLSYAERVLEK